MLNEITKMTSIFTDENKIISYLEQTFTSYAEKEVDLERQIDKINETGFLEGDFEEENRQLEDQLDQTIEKHNAFREKVKIYIPVN